MKLNICNTYIILVIGLINILTYVKNIAYADTHIVEIYSSNQDIDIIHNTIIFTKHVLVKYKNIQLFADKVIIIHDNHKHNLSTITAYGNPIQLHYIQKINYKISIIAKIMHYNAIENNITFSGDVYVKQSKHSIHSDNIIYFINQKKIQANSKKNNKTTTIFSLNLDTKNN